MNRRVRHRSHDLLFSGRSRSMLSCMHDFNFQLFLNAAAMHFNNNNQPYLLVAIYFSKSPGLRVRAYFARATKCMRKIPFKNRQRVQLHFTNFFLHFSHPPFPRSFVFAFQSQMWIKYEKNKIFCLLFCRCSHSHVSTRPSHHLQFRRSGLSCLLNRNRNDANAIRMPNGDAARRTFHSAASENGVRNETIFLLSFIDLPRCWCECLILALHTQLLLRSRCPESRYTHDNEDEFSGSMQCRGHPNSTFCSPANSIVKWAPKIIFSRIRWSDISFACKL